MTNCSVCKEQITDIEIIIDPKHSVCISCSNCQVCGKQVTIDDIRTCLIHNRTIKHDSCARVPRRRCNYLDNHGQQCDKWFPAIDSTKLCENHRGIISSNGTSDKLNETPKYIDLVNDQRQYCYHFLDGTAQNQSQKLIFEFKDDEDGSIFDKLDSHIAFIEKVLEDMKARLHSARAVRGEKLDALSESERSELRKIKLDKAVKEPKVKADKAPSLKKDPVSYLMKTKKMSEADAKESLNMDVDALLAKFELARKNKEISK